ncbi:MAG: hypothetical protein RLZ12_626 [Bacillota bacterium]
MGCVFCEIVAKKVPAKVVYEDDDLLVFPDIAPAAPVHLLLIPKKHIVSIGEAREEDVLLLGKILIVAGKVAKLSKLTQGFRLVSNIGRDGGQTVFHLHVHLLGGRGMPWPP